MPSPDTRPMPPGEDAHNATARAVVGAAYGPLLESPARRASSF